MKAAFYERLGPAREVLQIAEVDTPTAGPGQLLVRLRASGVNPSDVKARAGARAGQTRMPFPRIVPHSDGAGDVVAVGAGMTAEWVGRRVWLWNGQWQRPFGTAAEFVALPPGQVAPLADGISYEQGACLGIPAMTAHACVFAAGPVSGKTVLVTGGAGTVGALAIRMAKLSGARVIASVGSDAQGARAVRAGADHLVRHRSPDMATQIEAAAGSPVEHVVEVEYGANVDAVASVIAPNGTIATYGSAAVPQPEVPFYSLLFKAVTVRHVLVYILREAERHAAATDINAWLADGRLVPEIAHGLPLDEIAQAHEIVEKGGRAGSVVLTL